MSATHFTKQEFAETVDPLKLAGDLAFISAFMLAPNAKAAVPIIGALDHDQLRMIARYMGVTLSGTKQELFNRIFVNKETWLYLGTQTEATLSKLTNRELDNTLETVGKQIQSFTNKPQKVAHLLAWRGQVLERIRIAAAELIQERAVREAFLTRQPIGIRTAKAYDIEAPLEVWGYERINDEYRHNGSVTVAYQFDGKTYAAETFERLIERQWELLGYKHNALKNWWGRFWDYHPLGTWPDREFATRHFETTKRIISEAAGELKDLEAKLFRMLDARNAPPVSPAQMLFQPEMPLLAV